MNILIKKILIFTLISLLLSEGLIISVTSNDFFTKALAADTQKAEEFGIDDPSNLSADPAKEQIYELNDDMGMLTEALTNNKQKLAVDAYDRAELEKYVKLYAALEADPDAKKEYETKGTISKKLLDDLEITVDPATFDIRIINSLATLVKPKDLDGAGRDFVKVASIVKGYTSDRKAKSGRQVDPEQKVEDPTDYYSSHFKEFGQAVDITQIDYLRGTSFVYVGDQLVEKKKLSKIPIEVGWQTDEKLTGTGNTPSILGQNMNNLFSTVMGSLMGQTLQGRLEDQGIDVELSNDIVQGQTSAQIVQELGISWLKDNFDLPEGVENFSYNLSSTGTQIGQVLWAQTLNNVLPPEGISGDNLDELITNIGRETIAKEMGLPHYSLSGQKSQDLFGNIGKRTVENDLGLISGTFDSVDLKNAQKEDIIKKIGQGYTELTLDLSKGTFNDLNKDKIKATLGLKYDEINNNTKIVDSLLGVDPGTTEKFKNGDFAGFLLAVGNAQVNKTINFYSANDAAFNTSGISKLVNNPDENYFRDIGKDVVAKQLATDEETITATKKWLSTGKMPQTGVLGSSVDTVDTVNLSLLENKYKLAQNDLTRIFIGDKDNDLRSNDVFYRIGKNNLALALNYEQVNELKTDLETSTGDTFYDTQITDMKKQFALLESASKNDTKNNETINNAIKNIKDALNQIDSYNNNLQKTADGKESDLAVLLKTKQDVVLEETDTIQQNILAISKIKDYAQIKPINGIIDKIINGKDLPDFSKLEEKDLTGFSYNPYSVTFLKTQLINMLKGKESPDEAVRASGLAELSDNLDLPEEDTLINANKTMLSQPTSQWSATLQKAIGTDTLTQCTNEVNDSLNAMGRKTDLYNFNNENLLNLILGKQIVALQKIGGKVSNEAFGFLPGYGLKEYSEGSATDFNQILKGGGLQRVFQYLSLDRTPEQISDDPNKLSQSYAEEFLGMAKGALATDNITVPINISDIIAKNGDNGLERTLYSLGINIPQEITVKRDSDRNGYNLDLNNFFNKLKDPNADFWTNKDNQAHIIASVANVGWDAETVKSIITNNGKPQDYLSLVGKVIDNKISAQDPDGSFAFNDYFDLANSVFDGDFRIDGSNKPNVGKILGSLERVTNIDLESKLGVSSGSLATILSDSKNSQKELLTQGMRTLSKIFVNDPNINFTTVTSSTGTPLQLNVDYTLPVNLNMGNTNQWDLFGLTYKVGLNKNIPINLKVPLGSSQTQQVDFWNGPNGMDKTIANFTKIPQDFNKDIERFLKGDAKNALTAWGVAGATSKYQDWYNSFMSKIPSGGETYGPMNLVYGQVRNAFFDLLPNSLEMDGLLTETLADKSVKEAKDKVNSVDFNKYFDKKFDTFLSNFKGVKLKDLQYSVMDETIAEKVGFQNAPGPGFSKAMLEGSGFDKFKFLSTFVGKMGKGNLGEIGGLVSSSPVMTCFTGSCPDSNTMGDWFKNSPEVANKIDGQLRSITGWEFLPNGTFQAIVNNNYNGFDNLLKDQQTQFMIGNWLDKSVNMPVGTSYALWQQYDSYKTASVNLDNTISSFAQGGSAKDVLNAQNVLNSRTAIGVSLIMNLFLGKTFSQLDQQLGLPAGTASIIMSTVVYAAITGAALGTALLAVMGGPLGIILFAAGAILGMGKNKSSRAEVIYTACGYYPGYKDQQNEIGTLKAKAVSTNNADDWAAYQNAVDAYDTIAPDEVENGCPGEFHSESEALFKQGAKPASQYKIRALLDNVLSLDDLTNDKTMLPTQIQTWNSDDVAFYKDKTAEKFGSAVSPRQGMGRNQTMIDRVYFAY